MSNSSLLLIAMLFMSMASVGAQQSPPARPGPLPSIDDRTAGMQKIDGYFPLYWDERTGTMLLEIRGSTPTSCSRPGSSAGLGSNDIGLDRGQGGQGRVVQFQRVGPRVLLVQPNQSFRSSSQNPLERKSVEDSFAKSVLWGFAVAGRIERPRAGRRHRLLPARRPRRRPAPCGPATTASIARAARSTCRTPRTSRRTPKST